MLLIDSENTDVYFNLAAEDYLLHHHSEDVLMLWRSRSAVVCGKHQNVCAEVNYGFCRQNGIDVARRLSGGGTVFHDPGNINFTFIQTIPEGLEYAVNYRRFLEPIREALKSMGIETSYSERNDLLLEGKKISGNAEHVLQRQKRVLHHGTLLFNADLDSLGAALRPTGTYIDKAVKSVRSEVTNIANHYPRHNNPAEFHARLFQYFLDQKHTYRYVFNSHDLQEINNQRNSKYATEAWILGYSPSYVMKKEITLGKDSFRIHLATQNGQVQQLQFFDAAGNLCFSEITDTLNGTSLTEKSIADFFQKLPVTNISKEDIYHLF